MIYVECGCGAVCTATETEAGRVLTCPACKGRLLLACAEELPPEGGAGDFDAVLDLKSAKAPWRRVALGGVASIAVGRGATTAIRLNGEHLSEVHCTLERVDFGPSQWKLVDAGSDLGTYVNGQRITEVLLQAGDTIDIGECELHFAIAQAQPEPSESAQPPAVPPPVVKAPPVGGLTCPSCGKTLGPKAKFCVECGIDAKTGRAVAVSREFDADDFAIRADTWIRLVSWVVPLGFFPVASEAMGGRKPVATWLIASLTVVASILFFVGVLMDRGDPSPDLMNLMLWTGQPVAAKADTTDDVIMKQLREENAQEDKEDQLTEKQLQELAKSLRSRQAARGQQHQIPDGVGFRWYQTVTCALLHGGLMHLAGNLLFLIVFGLRVNELVGNLKFAIIYPLLAVASAVSYLTFSSTGPLHPMLGASGAIMGLAGMYFVFFPVQKVYMAIWLRLRFWCTYKVFRMPGFWLLVLWMFLQDILPMIIKSRDTVAHTAHLGGFVAGAAIALALMMARQANAGGSDILSIALGKKAWALMGKPSARMAKAAPPGQLAPNQPRAQSMNYPG